MKTKEFKDTIMPLSERIYPMAVRMLGNTSDAEDAVQEIMVKLWDRRKKIANHPNIPGYVFLTTKNYCLDILKKKRIKTDAIDFQLKSLKINAVHNDIELEELTRIIKALLKNLPDQQQEVMIMRDLDGLEFDEIASVMQLKIEHVRVLLSRARKQIGIKLRNVYSYE